MKADKPEPKITLSGAFRHRSAESVESLEECVLRDLEQLFRFGAKGDEAAVKSFHRIAGIAVKHLDKFCHHWPEGFEPLARKTSVWPGWLTYVMQECRKESICQTCCAGLNELNFAADAGPLNFSGKTWSLENNETAIAVRLYHRVESHREAWSRREETCKAIRDFRTE